MIDRRTFLLTPLVLENARAAERKPNVVLIAHPGWRGLAVPWVGDPDLVAPNLEKFGKESVVFTRAYAYSDFSSFDEIFKDAGYVTRSVGSGVGVDASSGPPLFWHFDFQGERTLSSSIPHLRENTPAANEAAALQELKAFYGMAQIADQNLAVILEMLRLAKVEEDTIVVFTSNRGDQMGSHGVDGGDSFYEESVRIPLAIRYPRVLKPAARDLASQADILPTLLALCGIELPEGTVGQNLFASNFAPNNEDSVYSHGKVGTKDEWRMVVRGYDKLVTTPAGEITHLFNLADDPYEMTDLAHDNSQKLKRDSLLALMRVWAKKLSDDPSGLRRRP